MTSEASTLMPSLPPSLYPVNDPTRQRQLQQQHQQPLLHVMAPALLSNRAESVVATHSSIIQPPQIKGRKLEDIVGRLKGNEKMT